MDDRGPRRAAGQEEPERKGGRRLARRPTLRESTAKRSITPARKMLTLDLEGKPNSFNRSSSREHHAMPISLPDARQLSDDVLQALRLRAIRGCELGYTETEVAALLGLARETVSRWWSAYAESGERALPGDRTGRPVGSGRTLNDGQAARLRTILVGHQPEDVSISSPLWTREAVRELIKKEYGIDMPVRTV